MADLESSAVVAGVVIVDIVCLGRAMAVAGVTRVGAGVSCAGAEEVCKSPFGEVFLG